MHYDVAIIGAGMSGLAAGIRLAYFGKSVCIFERHYAYGGLNSYFRLDGREYDVGLHAVTNFVRPGDRSAPMAKLLRQLRLTREDFALCEQKFSLIQFPGTTLRFTNDFEVLSGQVAERFPRDADAFQRLAREIREYPDTDLSIPYAAARPILRDRLRDPLLIEMLLCPIMYYGSAEENDMDFTQFVVLFKSLFFEGFGRPREGVRRIIKALVRKYREAGGKLRMRCGVSRLHVERGRVAGIELDDGETVTADTVISSAGLVETARLCAPTWENAKEQPLGRLSFVETTATLDVHPIALGHEATIVFFNDADGFEYRRPEGLVDLRSGVFCCPTNYREHEDLPEGIARITWMANHDEWAKLSTEEYGEAKKKLHADFVERMERFIAGSKGHIVALDMFTPTTIRRYTGHLGGAVYGSPRKVRDGRTPASNLFICGTDQGYLGIIGAMLSGITIANLHVLQKK